jgi:phosphoserine phosphatase
MRGRIPLEEVYGRRLRLVRPSRAALRELGETYVARLVPDAIDTVAALLASGVDVRIISGGLRPAVLAVAAVLGVPDQKVAAVDVTFGADGSYADFDSTSPLATNGGKRVAIERWNVPRPAMMVGDGRTDLEARPAVDLFVAFAGVIERPSVVQAADVVVRANSLAPLLPLALDVSDLVQTPYHAVYQRGVAMSATTKH